MTRKKKQTVYLYTEKEDHEEKKNATIFKLRRKFSIRSRRLDGFILKRRSSVGLRGGVLSVFDPLSTFLYFFFIPILVYTWNVHSSMELILCGTGRRTQHRCRYWSENKRTVPYITPYQKKKTKQNKQKKKELGCWCFFFGTKSRRSRKIFTTEASERSWVGSKNDIGCVKNFMV